MRILIDTNILIPLEDIDVDFDAKLAELTRLASGKHEILVHSASVEDISRDKNPARREAMLKRLEKYNQLSHPPVLSDTVEIELFGKPAKANHNVDNRILYSVYKDCAHWLVTRDVGIHRKAKALGVEERVLLLDHVIRALQKIESEAVNLYPRVEDVPCHTVNLNGSFFNSLRSGYAGFDLWFKEKCCQTGRRAWVYKDLDDVGAICVYKLEDDPLVTNDDKGLRGKALKLCTFKVEKRGYKIGELLLKQAFTYAKDNGVTNIYVTVDPSEHDLLHDLFIDFGFAKFGTDVKGRDDVYVKACPRTPPVNDDDPLDYAIKNYPMFKVSGNSAFLVPIQPNYHQILFPELKPQKELFGDQPNSAGNAIKQAYLCKSPNKSIKPGDILFFYRTQDDKCVTTYGVVDQFMIEECPEEIYKWVSKRTVYTYADIENMASKGKQVKVILFRLLGHLDQVVTFEKLKKENVVTGPIQSIISISKGSVKKMLIEAGCNDCFISD